MLLFFIIMGLLVYSALAALWVGIFRAHWGPNNDLWLAMAIVWPAGMIVFFADLWLLVLRNISQKISWLYYNLLHKVTHSEDKEPQPQL